MAQVNTTALGAVKGTGVVDALKKRRSMPAKSGRGYANPLW